MRSLLFASTLGAAHSMAVAHRSKKPAVQALMESAHNMLKNGAPTEVVKFAEETLEEVTGVVVPAIISESENDQLFLNNLYARFDKIKTELETGNTEINQLNTEEQQLSSDHKQCRDDEHKACYAEGGKRECEMEMYALWAKWVAEENTLRDKHDWIHKHFCPTDGVTPNGTTHEFRVAAAPEMDVYMKQKKVADAALLAYDEYVPTCKHAHSVLDSESSRCNQFQSDLELKACEHRTKIAEVATTFWGDYAQAEAAYQCAEEEVKHLQEDRHKEYVTLQVVQCLLLEIRNQNGVPCDTATEVDTRTRKCEELHQTVVCTEEPKLCLHYENVPQQPPPCAKRTEVTGYCMAGETPAPCCGAWQTHEVSPLPEFPVGPFSNSNPGCNARPDCTECPMVTIPQYQSVDTCPGYTIDGCPKDGTNDEHPLTLIRSVDGKADVRCCKEDLDKDAGYTCKSQDFKDGVDFTTPNANGGTHTSCYFDVTYQEALKVCHEADMRICSHTEMESDECCGTGCWHNHHAIWVDVEDPKLLDRPAVYSVTHDQHVEQLANRDNPDHEDYVAHREGIQSD